MKKKNTTHLSTSLWSLLFLLLPAVQLSAQSAFPSYAERGQFLLETPGASRHGLYGYANPALLNYVDRMENTLAFSTAPDGPNQSQ